MPHTLNDKALELAKRLLEYKGKDITIVELGADYSWADFGLICTGTSGAHIRGLKTAVESKLDDLSIEYKSIKRPDLDDEWVLIDAGDFIINLMNARARDFYALENLWRGNSTKIE